MARLLLLDDDAGTLGWMGMALEAHGHEVKGFTSARQALEVMSEWKPDLVISDIIMPDMDGMTFARLSRRHHVPIMFISIARKESEAVLVGAIGYLNKPATAQEVRAAVERVLGRRGERNSLLIVDDNPDVCELYSIYLASRFDVHCAEHGAAALEVLAKTPVDLVIVDLHMPVMNGVELIKRVRTDPRFERLPIIVQTSDTSALKAPVWRDLNVNQVIDKSDFFDWLSRQIDERVSAT